MIRLVAVMVISLALAVGSVTVAAATPSGIRGTVLRGPTTPVCREGVSCTAPAAGYALEFLRGGIRVATTTTTAEGAFRVALRPGLYTVRSRRKSVFGSLPPHTVRVLAGRFSVVELEIDTGIR